MRTKEEIATQHTKVKGALRKTPKSRNELATELGMDPGVVSSILRQICADGHAAKVGDKRGAKYTVN